MRFASIRGSWLGFSSSSSSARAIQEGSPKPIDIDVSQETLAEMIGTTRSRVSFFLNKFRKLGLISYNGKIEVHNSMLNAVLHDEPEIKRDEDPRIVITGKSSAALLGRPACTRDEAQETSA